MKKQKLNKKRTLKAIIILFNIILIGAMITTLQEAATLAAYRLNWLKLGVIIALYMINYILADNIKMEVLKK